MTLQLIKWHSLRFFTQQIPFHITLYGLFRHFTPSLSHYPTCTVTFFVILRPTYYLNIEDLLSIFTSLSNYSRRFSVPDRPFSPGHLSLGWCPQKSDQNDTWSTHWNSVTEVERPGGTTKTGPQEWHTVCKTIRTIEYFINVVEIYHTSLEDGWGRPR